MQELLHEAGNGFVADVESLVVGGVRRGRRKLVAGVLVTIGSALLIAGSPGGYLAVDDRAVNGRRRPRRRGTEYLTRGYSERFQRGH